MIAVRRKQLAGEAKRTFIKELPWRDTLKKYFPDTFTAGFSERHDEFWDWVWEIEAKSKPRPFIAIWPRGGGKSTSAESAVALIGARRKRKYCVYVCETQSQADDHVAAIAAKLDKLGIERKLDKYGQSQGWRRNRLRSDTFTVDALGLDVASRGKKIDDDRPDLIIFDDVDNQKDSPHMTKKKRKTITSSILPAMAAGCAVLFVQNVIHANSIAAELCDGRADFLTNRIVSGPHPAATHLKVEPHYDEDLARIRHIVTECEPTWNGQGKAEIQEAIDTYGLRDFMQESQHKVDEKEGALWSRKLLAACYAERPTSFKQIVVAVDPSGGGDEIGIVVVGLAHDGRGYVLADRTMKGSLGSLAWGREVVKAYREFKANFVIAESNFGGDMVKSTIKVADSDVPVRMVHASRGKDVRAEPVSALYGEMGEEGELVTLGSIRHCGVFSELETEMTTWTPDESWSPNRMDALVWGVTMLMLKHTQETAQSQPVAKRYFN